MTLRLDILGLADQEKFINLMVLSPLLMIKRWTSDKFLIPSIGPGPHLNCQFIFERDLMGSS